RRLALLIPLAVSLGAVGRVEESRAALAESLQLMPENLPVIRGRVIAATAYLDHLLGRHGVARELLHTSLEQLQDQGSKGATALKLELAVDYWLASDWNAMAVPAREALAAARKLGDRPMQAHAAALVAVGENHRGAVGRGAELVGEAGRVVDRASDVELANRIEVFLTLGFAECGVERFHDAARHLARGTAISRATGQGAWLGPLVNLHGTANLLLGELGEASELAETAMESALLGGDQPLVWALTLRCWLSLLQGDLAAAVEAGERALEIRERVPSTFYHWLAACTLAAVRIESGQPARGREEILREGGDDALTAFEPSWRPHWWAALGHAELGLGRVDAAEAWVERSEAGAEALALPGQIGEAGRARAALSLAREDAAAAAGQAQDAAERLEEAGRRIDAARARALAGRALAEAGGRERAVRELERAYSQLAASGAEGYRDEAARDLRRLGRRVPSATRSAPGEAGLVGLDEDERELSRLVARGLTNREIAARVFVSEKTVERRLTGIFRRLGLSARAELATLAERERLRSDPE
ncbi:MAG: helix-turn-helix transcriptional regulator, partial [Thermoleophilaceae bacterium]